MSWATAEGLKGLLGADVLTMMNWTTSLDDRWKVELDLNSFASLLCALPIGVAGIRRKKLIVSQVEGGVGWNPALINSTVRSN